MEDGPVHCLVLLEAQNANTELAMKFKQEANEALLGTCIPCPQLFVFTIFMFFPYCAHIMSLNCCNIDPV